MSFFDVKMADSFRSLLLLKQGEAVDNFEDDIFSTLEIVLGNYTILAIPPTQWKYQAILQFGSNFTDRYKLQYFCGQAYHAIATPYKHLLQG